MAGTFGLFVALFLPAVLGYSWIQLLWQDSHLAVRVGYGYLLGVCLTTLVLYIWGSAGLSLVFTPLALVLLLLTLMPVYIVRLLPQQRSQAVTRNFGMARHNLVWLVLLAILIARFSGLALENFWRPLYPWDAWMNWAPKAKVWFELHELLPFVRPNEWSQKSLEIGAYTLGNLHASTYPPLVPLIQLWTALGLGEWRDNIINLPWLLCVFAFGLAFYGQLRTIGVKPVFSIVVTYLLFSIPYLNTHVALAGYAELWMAAFYCAAVMSLINWNLTGSRKQLLLSLLMGIACAFIKKPGLVWTATLLPGILIGLFPVWLRHLPLGLFFAGIAFLIIVGGISLSLPGVQELVLSSSLIQIPGLGSFPLEFHPIGEFFVNNDLFHDNWHLLGWLLLILVPLVTFRPIVYKRLLPGLVVLTTGVLFIFIVFFYTGHYQTAIDSTTINRATFHLMPALFYFVTVVLSNWITNCPHIAFNSS